MKFSVITCTYNSDKYIEKNIRSIENQTFQNFEHIFIDGFSSDKTIAIIKKYQSKFPCKVKLFQFKPKGIANAMNKGIKKSQGEYIIHLHSDDSFVNEKILKNINNFIEHNNSPDLIYGKANFINTENGNSRIIPHRKIYHKIRFWLLLLTNYVPHQTVFIKKEMFDKWGMFDET
jgi:glycosyltransferase involved in cell wall biosynthesis